MRITPLKLYDAGTLRDDVLAMIAVNVRHPHDFLGDLRAMIGSARVGERRLLALLAEYGTKTVLAAVDEILDGAERQARACVRTWKDGVYRGEALLDDDGHGATDIHLRATVTKRGDALTIDLTDCHPQVTGLHQFLVPEHDVRRPHGLRLSHRSPDAEEFGHVPAREGDREAGDDRVAVPCRRP